MQSYKDLAVPCFVYSGQIIQTTDIPALFPAVVYLPSAGVKDGVEEEHQWSQSPLEKTLTDGHIFTF